MKSATMKCIFFMTTFLSTVQLWAQDKKMDVDIDINKKDADWYMQPWVWVVGAAVFIIIIVAILKGYSFLCSNDSIKVFIPGHPFSLQLNTNHYPTAGNRNHNNNNRICQFWLYKYW